MTEMDRAPDAEKLIAWVREAAHELKNAHAVLDDVGVPRAGEVEYSLARRIGVLLDHIKKEAMT